MLYSNIRSRTPLLGGSISPSRVCNQDPLARRIQPPLQGPYLGPSRQEDSAAPPGSVSWSPSSGGFSSPSRVCIQDPSLGGFSNPSRVCIQDPLVKRIQQPLQGLYPGPQEPSRFCKDHKTSSLKNREKINGYCGYCDTLLLPPFFIFILFSSPSALQGLYPGPPSQEDSKAPPGSVSRTPSLGGFSSPSRVCFLDPLVRKIQQPLQGL